MVPILAAVLCQLRIGNLTGILVLLEYQILFLYPMKHLLCRKLVGRFLVDQLLGFCNTMCRMSTHRIVLLLVLASIRILLLAIFVGIFRSRMVLLVLGTIVVLLLAWTLDKQLLRLSH